MTDAKQVLVTGASRGIGRAIARELARDGFHVVLNYRSGVAAAEEVAAVIEDEGGTASLLPFDVGARAEARAALAQHLEQRGPFWGVVLNAGITRDAPLASMDEAAWDDVLRTNLEGFFNVVQPLVMPMVRLRAGGRIVSISSITGRMGNRGQANYAASKAGLAAATRSLALELAKRGITANTVAPGYVETDMVAGLAQNELAATIPLRRFGRPEDVGALVRFLFSSAAGYITGQTLAVDGGLS